MTTLAECFDQFTATARKLETRRAYLEPSEAARLEAFRQHQPRPERSVRTSPWLARVAATTLAGKSWERIKVVGRPLSEYQRYSLLGLVESQAAGEQVRIADNSRAPALLALRDLWLFDAGTDHARLALMRFREDGTSAGAEITTDPAKITEAEAAWELAARHSVPLANYLADREREAEAA